MTSNWYETETDTTNAETTLRRSPAGWYAPLEEENSLRSALSVAADEENELEKNEDAPPKRRKTALRIISFILIIVLLIAASSVAFRRYSPDLGELPGFGSRDTDEPDAYPDNPEDFFNSYFEAEEPVEDTEIRLPETDPIPSLSFSAESSEEKSLLSLEELYQICAPSVVGIAASREGEIGYNWGTGVVLSVQEGVILTNAHVIEDCDRAEVSFSGSDQTCDARLIGADSISDLAVLRIDPDAIPGDITLRSAELGDSSELRVGQAVAAIGNPLGESFRNTLTDGIISAIERGMNYRGRSMTLLQTNTAINEGNSGGPLFNRYGQIVGITNMKMMSSYSGIEGIGFAIPSSTVCRVVNALLQEGEVRGRTAIGITVGAVPSEARERYELPAGLYVTAVSEGSDAEKQGIRPGDIIVRVDDTPVKTTAEISEIKDRKQVGDSLRFEIWRDGETLFFDIQLMDMNEVYS